MTTIVGIEHNGKAWIGADRCTTYTCNSLDIKSSADSKIVDVSGCDLLVGFAGDAVAGDIIKHTKMEIPKKYDERWMYVDFAKELKCALEEHVDGQDVLGIVSWHGRAFLLANGWKIARLPNNGVFAVGSGAPVALGNLYTFIGCFTDDAIESYITKALYAASYWDTWTEPPFDILYTAGKNV